MPWVQPEKDKKKEVNQNLPAISLKLNTVTEPGKMMNDEPIISST